MKTGIAKDYFSYIKKGELDFDELKKDVTGFNTEIRLPHFNVFGDVNEGINKLKEIMHNTSKLADSDINILAIQMPGITITKKSEFIPSLNIVAKIANNLNCKQIIVTRSRSEIGTKYIKNYINPILEENEIYLLWETTGSEKGTIKLGNEIIKGNKGLMEALNSNAFDELKLHGVCYYINNNVIKNEAINYQQDIIKYKDAIEIIHVSQKVRKYKTVRHSVLWEQSKINYDFIFKNLLFGWDGCVVLDYDERFYEIMKKDALMLEQKYSFK